MKSMFCGENSMKVLQARDQEEKDKKKAQQEAFRIARDEYKKHQTFFSRTQLVVIIDETWTWRMSTDSNTACINYNFSPQMCFQDQILKMLCNVTCTFVQFGGSFVENRLTRVLCFFRGGGRLTRSKDNVNYLLFLLTDSIIFSNFVCVEKIVVTWIIRYGARDKISKCIDVRKFKHCQRFKNVVITVFNK